MTQLFELYQSAVEKMLSYFAPILLLFTRLWVASIFLKSGYLKITTWDSTLYLFEEEYQVPLLPYELAAYLGTAAEIILPILLVSGFVSRFSALGLFFVNIVAVISLEYIAPAAYAEHVLWGVLLAQVFIFSGGWFTVDHLLQKKLTLQK